MTPKLFLFFALVALASCGENKDDITSTVDHSGSIETSIAVEHADSTRDVVVTTHKVWTNGQIASTIIHRDTIPGLGSIIANGENSNGDTANLKVPKDYQIFITMK
jgi:hypothetical protein